MGIKYKVEIACSNYMEAWLDHIYNIVYMQAAVIVQSKIKWTSLNIHAKNVKDLIETSKSVLNR